MTRTLRPRPPLAVSPAYVSQLTSLPLLGIDARRYLDVIVLVCKPDVACVGKLRLVELARAVEALRTLTAPADVEQREADEAYNDGQPTTAAGVLAKLGMELVT